jgi:hypothetical protein
MRIANALFAASLAAAILTGPVLAKSSGAQKTDEKQTATSCDNYQQQPDGSWAKEPCAELGAPGQTQHRSAPPQTHSEEAR